MIKIEIKIIYPKAFKFDLKFIKKVNSTQPQHHDVTKLDSKTLKNILRKKSPSLMWKCKEVNKQKYVKRVREKKIMIESVRNTKEKMLKNFLSGSN